MPSIHLGCLGNVHSLVKSSEMLIDTFLVNCCGNQCLPAHVPAAMRDLFKLSYPCVICCTNSHDASRNEEKITSNIVTGTMRCYLCFCYEY